MLVYEAARAFPVETYPVETPVSPTQGTRLANPPLLVPVLRAGLGMADATLALLPESSMGFVGLARDEHTFEPRAYMESLPADLAGIPVLVLDPMLATGGSLEHCCRLLADRGCTDITVICVLAAPDGHRPAGALRPAAAPGHRLDRRGPQRQDVHRPRPRRRGRPPVRRHAPVLTHGRPVSCNAGAKQLPFRAMTTVPIAEELLLLAYDNESGKATGSRIGLDLGMAAAVLVELALAGRIAYADGMIVVIDHPPTGAPGDRRRAAKIAANPPAHPGLVGAAAAARPARPRPGRPDQPGRDPRRRRGRARATSTSTATRRSTATVENETRGRLAAALAGERGARRAHRRARHADRRPPGWSRPWVSPATEARDGARAAGAHRRAAPGSPAASSLDQSTVRPSVALVVTALGKAIQTALGTPAPGHPLDAGACQLAVRGAKATSSAIAALRCGIVASAVSDPTGPPAGAPSG